jgi:hypothetical protein
MEQHHRRDARPALPWPTAVAKRQVQRAGRPRGEPDEGQRRPAAADPQRLGAVGKLGSTQARSSRSRQRILEAVGGAAAVQVGGLHGEPGGGTPRLGLPDRGP